LIETPKLQVCQMAMIRLIYHELKPFASTRSAGCSQSDGTMDSHLHAVSGVSSCLQRNQDESKQQQSRARGDYGSQSRRVIVRMAASRSCDHPLVLGHIALPAVQLQRTTHSRYRSQNHLNVQYESYATCDARF
jgi:hypothetical protein